MVERATALHIAPKPQRLGTLILLRHGESVWNVPEDERYTGWTDIPLTKRGEEEARLAGLTLAKRGVFVDKAFTSVPKSSLTFYPSLDFFFYFLTVCVVRSKVVIILVETIFFYF